MFFRFGGTLGNFGSACKGVINNVVMKNHFGRHDDKDDHHGWGHGHGRDKDDHDKDHHGHHDHHGGSDCGDDNDDDCGGAADGVDITIPENAHSAILVIENNDDNDDEYDDYVRVYADDVEDPSNLDDYVAAAEEEYAARGDDLDSCDEVLKVVVEDADGKVIKVLYKDGDGNYTDKDPRAEGDSDDSGDDGDNSDDDNNDDDDDKDCGGISKFLKVIHGRHDRDDDRDDHNDDDDDHGHGGHHYQWAC